MKQGKNMEQLGAELRRQRLARKDILAGTEKLIFRTDENGTSRLYIKVGERWENYTVSALVHRQIASRLNIPFRYYERMFTEHRNLLDENVNGWFTKTPHKWLIRVLDNTARAFLSDRYRRLDNLELCAAVLPVIRSMKGAEIKSCEITDTHLYIKVINRNMKAEIRKGDIVQAGFVVSNSEVGLGSLRVEPLVYRLVCENGLIVKDFGKKKYHAGRQIGCTEESYELYSDETLAQDDKAFFMKVRDIVRTAADEARFGLIVNRMRQAADTRIKEAPDEEVRILGDKFSLNTDEQNEIMRQFFLQGEDTWYGLMNAVTAASRNLEDYERATDLERIGGDILSMNFGGKQSSDVKSNRKRNYGREQTEESPIRYAPLEEVVAR